MPRRAWMPVYVGDYLRDTMHLTTEEHGAYFLLLMAYWNRGKPLPDDDHFLANTTRLRLSRWKHLRKSLAPFFEIEHGVWHQRRADVEIQASEGRQIHASAAATAKWSKLGIHRASVEQASGISPKHALSQSQYTPPEEGVSVPLKNQTPPTVEEVVAYAQGTTIPEAYARRYVEKCHARHRWFVKTPDGPRLINWQRDLVTWWTEDRNKWKDPKQNANHKQHRQHGVKSRSEGTANEGHTSGYSAAAARQRSSGQV